MGVKTLAQDSSHMLPPEPQLDYFRHFELRNLPSGRVLMMLIVKKKMLMYRKICKLYEVICFHSIL